jgi:4-amino-4-deoxy-L-arabinose transferase-like glycosyltransferase
VLVFSLAEGIYHPYYTSALAPAIAALVGAGAAMVWQRRAERGVVGATAVVLVGSAALTWYLFDRASWNTWIGPTVTVVAALAAAGLLFGSVVGHERSLRYGLGGGLVALLVAMGVYAGASVVTDNTLIMSPSAGPAGMASSGPGGSGGPGGQPGYLGVGGPGGGPGDGGLAPDGFPGTDGQLAPPGLDDLADGQLAPPGVDDLPDGTAQGTAPGASGLPGAGPSGGLIDSADELADWLLDRWEGETWIVAVSTTNTASPITLAGDGAPVMTMGGFNGADPTPTADELAQFVADGEVRFVVASGVSGPGGGQASGQVAAERTAWVESNCALVDDAPIEGLYDCAADLGP